MLDLGKMHISIALKYFVRKEAFGLLFPLAEEDNEGSDEEERGDDVKQEKGDIEESAKLVEEIRKLVGGCEQQDVTIEDIPDSFPQKSKCID